MADKKEVAQNAVDLHVGRQIRFRRNFLGMTQQDLARRLDITFQQVQKYERGANRVGASRLWDISQILKTDISFFFDNMPKAVSDASPRMKMNENTQSQEIDASLNKMVTDPMLKRETLELLRSYYLIKRPHIRKKMAMIIREAAQKEQTVSEKE